MMRRAWPLRSANHLFVTHIENAAAWQHAAPMRHQLFVALVIAPKLGEVVGVVLLGGKQFRVAGKAGVDRIAHGVDDLGIRQREMDEAGKIIIGDTRGEGSQGNQQRVEKRRVAAGDEKNFTERA